MDVNKTSVGFSCVSARWYSVSTPEIQKGNGMPVTSAREDARLTALMVDEPTLRGA